MLQVFVCVEIVVVAAQDWKRNPWFFSELWNELYHPLRLSAQSLCQNETG